MSKPIFTSLAPNTQKDDTLKAFALLFQPWRWQRGQAPSKLEKTIQKYLPTKSAFAFSSGRGALYAILSCLDLQTDDEVLIQAYTCVAVPNPILKVGAKPIYVDIDSKTFTISPEDFAKKITPKSRVLIVQHTFGQPAHLDEILKIARKHKLFVIEDCAHALGATYHQKKVGVLGDAAFFSFGRDKSLSSVFGGLTVTNQKPLAEKLTAFHQKSPRAKYRWIFRQLLHPIITYLSRVTYRVFLGKLLLGLARKLHLLSKPVVPREKKGQTPAYLLTQMPNALAHLALHQFHKLDKFNQHRQKIAALYEKELQNSPYQLPAKIPQTDSSYLRFTIQTENPAAILKAAKKDNLFLDHWYHCPIAPEGVDHHAIHYPDHACPIAQKTARKSLNLPTDIHIVKEDALRISEFLLKMGPH